MATAQPANTDTASTKEYNPMPKKPVQWFVTCLCGFLVFSASPFLGMFGDTTDSVRITLVAVIVMAGVIVAK